MLYGVMRARVSRAAFEESVAHALRFVRAALLARFASAGANRVVVAFDDGDFARSAPN